MACPDPETQLLLLQPLGGLTFRLWGVVPPSLREQLQPQAAPPQAPGWWCHGQNAQSEYVIIQCSPVPNISEAGSPHPDLCCPRSSPRSSRVLPCQQRG